MAAGRSAQFNHSRTFCAAARPAFGSLCLLSAYCRFRGRRHGCSQRTLALTVDSIVRRLGGGTFHPYGIQADAVQPSYIRISGGCVRAYVVLPGFSNPSSSRMSSVLLRSVFASHYKRKKRKKERKAEKGAYGYRSVGGNQGFQMALGG